LPLTVLFPKAYFAFILILFVEERERAVSVTVRDAVWRQAEVDERSRTGRRFYLLSRPGEEAPEGSRRCCATPSPRGKVAARAIALWDQRAALHIHADEVAVGNAAGVAAFPVGWAVRAGVADGGGELGVGRQDTRAGGLPRSIRQGGQELRDRG